MTEGEGEVWPRVVKLGDCGLPQVDGFFRGIGLEQKVGGVEGGWNQWRRECGLGGCS